MVIVLTVVIVVEVVVAAKVVKVFVVEGRTKAKTTITQQTEPLSQDVPNSSP